MANCLSCIGSFYAKCYQKSCRYYCISGLLSSKTSFVNNNTPGQSCSRHLTTSRQCSSKLTATVKEIKATLSKQLNELYAQYEEFVGLAEVQNAQQEVKKVCALRLDLLHYHHHLYHCQFNLLMKLMLIL